MKNLFIALLLITGLTSCKKETKKNNTKNILSENTEVTEVKKSTTLNSCNELLSFYDEEIVDLEKEYVVYCNIVNTYMEKNNKTFMDLMKNEPKEIELPGKQLESVLNKFYKKFNYKKNEKKFIECRKDSIFIETVKGKIERSKNNIINKSPKKMKPMIEIMIKNALENPIIGSKF